MRQIKEVRAGGAVQRWHTEPTIRSQSVAEHSWAVAQLVLRVAPNCRVELLRAALNHDLPEVDTGDIPAPVKWANSGFSEVLAEIEREYHVRNGTGYGLTSEEQHILKWCDMMELVIWCHEEVLMGNMNANTIRLRGRAFLVTLGHPNANAEEIFNGSE